jgi:hypothetical protein
MEEIRLVIEAGEQPGSWWARYSLSLEDSALSSTARRVLEHDCAYIVDQITGNAEGPDLVWPATRHRRGVVMGAVQSGKTASMLGVGARALDNGVTIIVVLAGTRVALWRQTYERLTKQLDRSDSESQVLRADERILVPPPSLMADDENGARSRPQDLYRITSARSRDALESGRPIVMVVMKHAQHLHWAAEVLRRNVYPHLDDLSGDAHLLVLDDEADDGSILDARVEQNLNPAFDYFKQLPRQIVDLWSDRASAPATIHPRLKATYVGYTATPQANFLQSDQNPLAPRDFICALRTPSDTGELTPRSTTYRDPAGLGTYYTGGDAFYRRLRGAASLMVSQPPAVAQCDKAEEDARRTWVAGAVRAYLVAGAIRLLRGAVSPAGVQEVDFATRQDVVKACPSPHTMLFHPSSAVDQHFAATAELISWSHGVRLDEAQRLVADGIRHMSVDAIETDMSRHPELWTCWLHSYRASADALIGAYALEKTRSIPGPEAWADIRELIVREVAPNVRIAVVNSDPEADDRPQFEPQRMGDGTWRAPRDLMTIFVSGNVMARGLTLEGLTTTLFLRMSDTPVADTQMQMQRWFGYRAHDLELCRVFAPEEQLSLFRQYHETDEALRRQIVHEMNISGGSAPTPLVLEGSGFAATAKIAGVAKVPLCPGATPFIDLVNVSGGQDPNLSVVAELFQGRSSPVTTGSLVRGRILDETLSMSDAAAVLDQLSYVDYRPGPDDVLADRWVALESQLGMAGASHPLVPFFRPPPVEAAEPSPILPRRCPYTIAAYLRLWEAALTRHAPGLFATDDGDTPWDRLNLRSRGASRPNFYVGIRYGEADICPDPRIRDLPFHVRPMRRTVVNGRVDSTWGSQNPSSERGAHYRDKLFDYAYHGLQPVPFVDDDLPSWRPVGAPGLILFHIIEPRDGGQPVVAVGVALPLGGPDHFAARVRRT